MYLGVDIGGSNGRVTAFRGLDDTVEIGRIEFTITKAPFGDFSRDFENLVDACRKLARLYGRIKGIGMALAGVLDQDRTMLIAAGNLGHWINQPVVPMLAQALNFDGSIALGGDTKAAALAEAKYGKGRKSAFWFIGWGTGVGGSLVQRVNGVPASFAGEVGHQRVSPRDDLLCGCGQMGCLEAYCGGEGIRKRFGIDARDLTDVQWAEVFGWMAIGIRNIVTIQPVPLMIFGGGISVKQFARFDLLRQLLEADLRIVGPPEIQLSAFGESAGTVGSLALLRVR